MPSKPRTRRSGGREEISLEPEDAAPIWVQRARLGLSTPSWEEKRQTWSRLSIPQAGITSKEGGYIPFAIVDQAHRHPALSILLTGGIRASKSVSSAAEIVAWSPHSDLIWLAADTYDLSRQEFEYATEALLSLGWTTPSLIQLPHNRYFPCVVETLWGTLIETRSLHDVNSFVARAPDMIVLCEPGLADPRSLIKARERLSTKRGRLWMAGCLAADTVVFTSNGMQCLGDIVPHGQPQIVPADFDIAAPHSSVPVIQTFYNYAGPTIRVELAGGLHLEGTPDHKIMAYKPMKMTRLAELKKGSRVPIRVGANVWGTAPIDDAYLLGLYTAEGSLEIGGGHQKTWRTTITNQSRGVTGWLRARGFRTYDGLHWRKSSRALVERLEPAGRGAHNKVVHPAVKTAPRVNILEYLRGLFDGDGSYQKDKIYYSTCSEQLAEEVQQLLINAGFMALRYKQTEIQWQVYIHPSDARRFVSEVRPLKFVPEFDEEYGRGIISNRQGELYYARVTGRTYGFAETYDITVGADDHRYIANSFISFNTFEEARFNWMEDYWRKWARWPNAESGKSFSIPTWVNKVIYPGGKNDPAIRLLRASYKTFEEFLLRCCGVPVPQLSLVVGDSFNPRIHIAPTEFQRFTSDMVLVPVELALDPGYSGSHYVVLAVQFRDDQLFVIDEIATVNTEVSAVIVEAQQRDWWTNVSGGAIDPWASTQHPFGGPTPMSVWWNEARIRLRSPQRMYVETLVGIIKDALRERGANGRPKVIIDPKCERLIWELKDGWRRKKSPEGLGEPSKKNCDAAKALGYLLSEVRTRQMMQTRGTVDLAPKVVDLRIGG